MSESPPEALSSFADIYAENASVGFDETSYLCYVNQVRDLSSDFYLCLFRLIDPELVIIDNCALIKEISAEARYAKERTNGRKSGEAQFWANTLVVSEFLGDVSHETYEACANLLLKGWQAKLHRAGRHQEKLRLTRIGDREFWLTASSWWPDA